MNEHAPVGFVDSGIGGLPYLQRVREVLPTERFVYLADRESFPYGGREPGEIENIVTTSVERLVQAANPKLIVVACNTASVVSLDNLRSRFSIPFVGVVPAIKPAAAKTRNGRIGLLATERTVSGPYVDWLEDMFAREKMMVRVPAPGLVEMIEEQFPGVTEEDYAAALEEPVRTLLAASADTVVLGCTHFVHVRSELERRLGSAVEVLDSVDGVAGQVRRVCNPAGSRGASFEDLMLVTGNRGLTSNYRELAVHFGLKLQRLNDLV